MKYYVVTSMRGYVCRNKYVSITYPIIAESGKDATKKIHWIPRVKHNYKYCIKSVLEITQEEYKNLNVFNSKNQYLKRKNILEQNKLCQDLHIQKITNNKIIFDKEKRLERINYKKRKDNLLRKENSQITKNFYLDSIYS